MVSDSRQSTSTIEMIDSYYSYLADSIRIRHRIRKIRSKSESSESDQIRPTVELWREIKRPPERDDDDRCDRPPPYDTSILDPHQSPPPTIHHTKYQPPLPPSTLNPIDRHKGLQWAANGKKRKILCCIECQSFPSSFLLE